MGGIKCVFFVLLKGEAGIVFCSEFMGIKAIFTC